MDWADHRILVVEDDYHTAQYWSHAIRSAGAEVIGPCPSTAAAAEALEDESVTAATLDVDLIDGRS